MLPCGWFAGCGQGIAAIALVTMMALSGCGSGPLPRSEIVTRSPWKTFDEAKAAYDQVTPGVTTMGQFRAAGFDPISGHNLRVLSYLDVMRHFLTTDAIKTADLDPAVQKCIAARDGCIGYVMALENIQRQRQGSALSDLFNFNRDTRETGWSFSGLFLMQGGIVTYKLWSGVPRIDRRIQQENPLGPVQEPATILRDRVL